MLAHQKTDRAKTSATESRPQSLAHDGAEVSLLNPLWQSLVLNPMALQPKLTVSQPDDPYEREADRIADRVMSAPAAQSNDAGISVSANVSLRAQRKCGPCQEEEENKVQRKADGNDSASSPVSAPAVIPAGVSHPLDPSTRIFMEQQFGSDFGRVQVHANTAAAESAQALGARAYTVGHHVVFAAGQYAPQTTTGRRLLAHELTHVVQQTSTGNFNRISTSASGIVQRSMDTYIKAMSQKPEPNWALAAEHLNGEEPKDIKIVLRNLSSQYRVKLHKAARTWPGVCSNIARFTERDFLKVEPTAAKAEDVCKASPPTPPAAPPPAAPPPAAPPPSAPPVAPEAGCSIKHVETECNNATASCTKAADYCAKNYPNASDIDAQIAKGRAKAKELAIKAPNASANMLHFLDNTGTEKVMPTAAFENHKQTQNALLRHREKFLKGARKRLDAGTLLPDTLSEQLIWTDTADAFSFLFEDDLGYAVGGYTLCSKARVKANKTGSDTYQITFVEWTVQAFDCYNWDPGKGINLPGASDNDMCCIENAGKGKHFRVRTDPWENKFAESIKPGDV